VERLALRPRWSSRRQMRELQEQHDSAAQAVHRAAGCQQCEISDRAETTYLNIIGGMLTLMLGQSPSGVPYSSFKTQEALSSRIGRPLRRHHGHHGANLERQVRQRQEVRP
jgi:hypothetical protein